MTRSYDDHDDDDQVLLFALIDQVKVRKAVTDRTDREASRAIKANAAAHAALAESVRTARELLAALTNGAGHDKPHPLGPARAAARALVAEGTPDLDVTPPE